jgi:hypothetical protein
VPLVIDLDRHQLSGVGIGDPVERLSFLGPAVVGVGFEFREKGVIVSPTSVDQLWEFSAILTPVGREHVLPFAGSFQFRGNRLALTPSTREADLLRLFGPPYWRDQDDDEVILFYEHGPVEWQLELSPDGALQAVTIGTPLMAEPEQRAAFKVTKPWPPSG